MSNKAYHEALTLIKQETGCTHKEAMQIYRDRKAAAKKEADAAEAKTEKAKETESNDESVPAEMDGKPEADKKEDKVEILPAKANAGEQKIKNVTSFILGRKMTIGQMHSYIESQLGGNAIQCPHPTNVRQMRFKHEGSYIPKEGYFTVG